MRKWYKTKHNESTLKLHRLGEAKWLGTPWSRISKASWIVRTSFHFIVIPFFSSANKRSAGHVYRVIREWREVSVRRGLSSSRSPLFLSFPPFPLCSQPSLSLPRHYQLPSYFFASPCTFVSRSFHFVSQWLQPFIVEYFIPFFSISLQSLGLYYFLFIPRYSSARCFDRCLYWTPFTMPEMMSLYACLRIYICHPVVASFLSSLVVPLFLLCQRLLLSLLSIYFLRLFVLSLAFSSFAFR